MSYVWKFALVFHFLVRETLGPPLPLSSSPNTLRHGSGVRYLGLIKYLRYSIYLTPPWSLCTGNQILRVCVLIKKKAGSLHTRGPHAATCMYSRAHAKNYTGKPLYHTRLIKMCYETQTFFLSRHNIPPVNSASVDNLMKKRSTSSPWLHSWLCMSPIEPTGIRTAGGCTATLWYLLTCMCALHVWVCVRVLKNSMMPHTL